MNFIFETLSDLDLINGSYYIADFGKQEDQNETAVLEGKLITAFGAPAAISDNYENSFDYVIKATAEDGRSVVLVVYNVGQIHIGAKDKDDFTMSAAQALVDYVSVVHPTDYERVLYYMDFFLRINIKVTDGVAEVNYTELNEEEIKELEKRWYQ